jgi:RimJ/RimL family protein N-acetyltransferase
VPIASLRPTSDGLVTIRPPEPGDAEVLVAGRDEVSRRFLGPGDEQPRPTACIVVGGQVVGWVDHDVGRSWLRPGEVNVGYHVAAPHRGNGYATRAVQLLLHHLAVDTDHRVATLLISAENERSLALASRARFVPVGDLDGHPYFKRAVPPLSYGDGVVRIRRQRAADLEADLEAKDDEQIDRLWLPGQRAAWEAMSGADRRAHALRGLLAGAEGFRTGPRWTFAVDTADAGAVAGVACDLANVDVPPGEANISYWCHPDHRGNGYVSRAVRLVLAFLADHTGAREAHLLVDADNQASLRVASAVAARPAGPVIDERAATGR